MWWIMINHRHDVMYDDIIERASHLGLFNITEESEIWNRRESSPLAVLYYSFSKWPLRDRKVLLAHGVVRAFLPALANYIFKIAPKAD